MHMTDITVLISTKVSDDGVSTRPIVAGTEDKVRSDLFPGLEAEGYVAALGDQPPADGSKGPVIPADWRDLHHFKLVALAKSLGAEASTKAEAIAAIEAAEKSAQA